MSASFDDMKIIDIVWWSKMLLLHYDLIRSFNLVLLLHAYLGDVKIEGAAESLHWPVEYALQSCVKERKNTN